MRFVLPLALISYLVAIEATGIAANETTTETLESNEAENETCEKEHEKGLRFHVAKFDFDNVATPLLVSIWILFVSAAKIAFRSNKKLAKLVPESCLLILIGVLLGVILYFADASDNHQLNTHTFFLIILPPIIMDAGYFMPSRAFFDQFGTILLFAVFGTLINTLMIGFSLWGIGTTGLFGDDVCLPMLHALVFASLLAAVDPVAVLAVFEQIHVNEVLYIVVFGEALLNDGISVVLYHLFEGFSLIGQENIETIDIIAGIGSFFVIVIGAPGIGILLGLLGGFLSRFTNRIRIMEPLIVLVICYMSFIVPEMFHLSGILGCTFCGITMRKYVEANISEKSQTTIKYAMKMMASVAEAIIFMYLGIAAVSKDRVWNTRFILLTLGFCLVYRVIGVIIQTFMVNRVRLQKLTVRDQFIMSFGGLRGAIAFGLSVNLEEEEFGNKELFVTATIVVIYFTNIIMGTAVEPLIKLLKVKRDEHRSPTLNEKLANRLIDHLMIAVEAVSEQRGHHSLRERFSAFNNKYLKPCVIGAKPRRKQNMRGRGSEIWRVYRESTAKDARFVSKQVGTAATMKRWRNSVGSGLDFLGRSQSVYEHPYYWRSELSLTGATHSGGASRNNLSNMDNSPGGVYMIPGVPIVNENTGNAATTCSCACHANGIMTDGNLATSSSLDFDHSCLFTDSQISVTETDERHKRIGMDVIKNKRVSRPSEGVYAKLRELERASPVTFNIEGLPTEFYVTSGSARNGFVNGGATAADESLDGTEIKF